MNPTIRQFYKIYAPPCPTWFMKEERKALISELISTNASQSEVFKRIDEFKFKRIDEFKFKKMLL